MTDYHAPVLLKESVDALVTDADGTYVDVTFGGGGHSKEILKRLSKKGRIIAFDQDTDAVNNTIDDKRFMLITGNFRYMTNFLRYHNALPVTGVLADLGISSHQIDTSVRGFSTRFDSALDMRMNREATVSAMQVINDYPEEKLRDIFREYSDLREARNIAKKIIARRAENKIETTGQLMEILKTETHRGQEFQFFARVFQGIRIEVNKELDALKELLIGCRNAIAENGRMVMISYHSLEDRLVKNFIAAGNFSGEMEKDVITGQPAKTFFSAFSKKPVEATAEEIETNSRARSARLRVGIKNLS